MFDHLFQPVTIGKFTLKNRLFRAPTQCSTVNHDGFITDLTYEYYERQAKGGWGLVTLSAAYIRPDGQPFPTFLCAATEEHIKEMAKLADIMHKNGLPACIQPVHGGRGALKQFTGMQPMAPSEVLTKGGVVEWPPAGEPLPRAMTESDIEQLINDFALTLIRLKKHGFDMALLHGAHGFIFNQFQAAYTNRRTDKWGNPAAFTVEVIKRCREVVGPDFALGLRMNGSDFYEGGITLEQSVRMAPEFVAAGLDWLDISAGTRETPWWALQPIYFPRGCIVHLAEAIKKVVSVPVVTVGRINDPRLAEDIIAKGKADIVSISRGSLADPELPLKAREGRLDDIRRCMGCDLCMGASLAFHTPVMCAENYDIGRHKSETEINPTASPKKIVVVGGGVGGMEFARVATLRGHDVTLYEKESKLGGSVAALASRIPNLNTHDLMNSVIWLTTQLKKQGIRVVLGKEVTPTFVAKQRPDVIVLATGSLPAVPQIPGIDGSNVIILDDYLKNRPRVGQRVVVIGGGNGFETAVSLGKARHMVTLVEETGDVGSVAYVTRRRKLPLLDLIRELNVSILTDTKVKEINKSGVLITAKDEKERLIEADTVIIALNRLPNNALKTALEKQFKQVYAIGDCVEPQNTKNAIHSASRLAREI